MGLDPMIRRFDPCHGNHMVVGFDSVIGGSNPSTLTKGFHTPLKSRPMVASHILSGRGGSWTPPSF